MRSIELLTPRSTTHQTPENVLFSDPDTLTLKLADFGLALNLREERAVTRVGTLGARACVCCVCACGGGGGVGGGYWVGGGDSRGTLHKQ